MVPYDEPIYGFSGEQVSTRDYIDLHNVFRDGAQTKTIPIRFLIIDAPTSYNVLLGRPSLNTLGAVVSTPYSGHEVPLPICRHPHHSWQPTPCTQMLYGQPTPTAPHPANQSH